MIRRNSKNAIISLMLVIVLCLSFPMTCFAQSEECYNQIDTSNTKCDYDELNQEQIKNLKGIFESLSPEAKRIYEESLSEDPALFAFHIKYINPDIQIESKFSRNVLNNSISGNIYLIRSRKSSVRAASCAPTSNELSDLYRSLQDLNLPAEVYTALKMFIASLTAGVAEGPLPAAKVAMIIAGVGLVAVVALNWDKISPKWDKIKSLITKTFKKSKAGVTKALGDATKEIQNKAKSSKKAKTSKSAWNKSAKGALDKVDPNKKNHIINNKIHDHKWSDLFGGKKPSWNDIYPILLKALKEGNESYDSKKKIYVRKIAYKGYKVVVTFLKSNGLVSKIGTAYIESK